MKYVTKHIMNRIETNWYVITGGPCTGKTTMVNMLSERGYKTTIEHARHYIDTQKDQGETVEAIRENKRQFQTGILKMQIEEEQGLDPNEIVFLDRAIPDAEAYYNFLGLEYDDLLIDAMGQYCYKKVFILDRLPLIQDYARREDESEQIRIHNLIIKVYEYEPCPVFYVPVLDPESRVQLILDNL